VVLWADPPDGAFCRPITAALFQTKKPFDMSRKSIINFTMPWDRLFLTCGWISEYVVLCAVPVENTPGGQQFPNEFVPFQMAISFVKYPSGTSSIAIRL
jgi:hypothetical protein